jgi:hypothetical protein
VKAKGAHSASTTCQLHFRMRTTLAGTFTYSPGEAEAMYRNDVCGASAGQRVAITR